MKISALAQFNECFFPIIDGVTFTVKNYAHWLNHKIAPTYVVTPSYPRYIENEEFPVIRYASAPLPFRAPYRIGLPLLSQSLVSRLKQLPLHLVHAHSPFTAGHLALKIARMKGIPIIGTFHSKYRADFERWIPNRSVVDYLVHQVVQFYESVDEVWIPQKTVESTLREYGYKGRVEVVENGVDFLPAPETLHLRDVSRQTLGLSPDANILLYVGQHIWEKNLEFLLKSLRCLSETEFTMYFIGEGYAKREMRSLAFNLKIADKVKFLDPIYQRKTLMSWYAAADIFLFPSIYDNAPLVLREAAAMQTPGLLIEGSTASEVIINNSNGFLSGNNQTSYAEKIRFLLSQKGNLIEAGRVASKTICRLWEDIVDEVIARYQFVIAKGTRIQP